MKISELVTQLEALWAEHGDVSVVIDGSWEDSEPVLKYATRKNLLYIY